jgi:dGTP triphosphohydrolase
MTNGDQTIRLLESLIRLQSVVYELAKTVETLAELEKHRSERLTVANERLAGSVAAFVESARLLTEREVIAHIQSEQPLPIPEFSKKHPK